MRKGVGARRGRKGDRGEGQRAKEVESEERRVSEREGGHGGQSGVSHSRQHSYLMCWMGGS